MPTPDCCKLLGRQSALHKAVLAAALFDETGLDAALFVPFASRVSAGV
jgi:hypothetical protein